MYLREQVESTGGKESGKVSAVQFLRAQEKVNKAFDLKKKKKYTPVHLIVYTSWKAQE